MSEDKKPTEEFEPKGAMAIALILIVTVIVLWSWVYMTMLERGMTS
ncbi:MAG: cytochrome c oxidase subunit 2A [Anaerolineae bacterium]|nr:cytochrome c oxidase subunit 2A [Anaerolineae bacterium]MBT7076013.1 cytochrome c oxidase subunit 2A [Anaerolineae bacterium]MBT7782587.1 cytochrome c oxidase subunit 2A [Anaerolineae bacterium]